jgi:multiple sugar transport system ATP-binding protein
MATVTFDNATRRYPGMAGPAVDGLTLDIADGEFLVMVGPTGCGKSTALRMLAGLEDMDAGRVLIDGRDVTAVPANDRDVAMVFQNYALYPHMTVADNMGFALKIAGVPEDELAQRVLEAARLLELEEFLDRKPKALSGGQRQRVAMGRAIVRHPRVFLMDEPLSNLDAALRAQTRAQIASLTRRLGVTTVYVTHDQVEAMTLGDRVAVLRDGVLQQVAPPRELYDRPANLFVAGFIGSPPMNLLELAVDDGAVQLGGVALQLPAAVPAASLSSVVLGVRPEDFEIAGDPPAGLAVKVESVEELGADAFLHGKAAPAGPGRQPVRLTARVDVRQPPEPGTTVHLLPRADRVHFFDPATRRRLG